MTATRPAGTADPVRADGSSGSTAALDAVLSNAVTGGRIPGAVAAVGRSGGELWTGTAGFADPAGQRPLGLASRFRLASMTKLITALAVLQVVDDGRLDLDQPVVAVLPEFGDLMVLDGIVEGVVRLRAPSRSATVRELLAHTSGLSYEVWNSDVLAYQQLTGTPGIASGLRAVLCTPLVDDPGARIEYGTGFDWAGVLLERLTGLSLDEFCRLRIFEPLAMGSTSMERIPGRQHVPVLSGTGGRFELTDIDYPAEPDFRTGGGCVWTTAGDYLRLLRMMLNGGCLDGVRVASEHAIDEVLANQTGALEFPRMRSCVPSLSDDVDLGPGQSWGFGIVVNAAAAPGRRSAGSGGWWGIFNSTFWIDRSADVAAVLLMQFVPFFCAGARRTAGDFETAVYAELTAARP